VTRLGRLPQRSVAALSCRKVSHPGIISTCRITPLVAPDRLYVQTPDFVCRRDFVCKAPSPPSPAFGHPLPKERATKPPSSLTLVPRPCLPDTSMDGARRPRGCENHLRGVVRDSHGWCAWPSAAQGTHPWMVQTDYRGAKTDPRATLNPSMDGVHGPPRCVNALGRSNRHIHGYLSACFGYAQSHPWMGLTMVERCLMELEGQRTPSMDVANDIHGRVTAIRR
jgi:hypothetical protein